jgi:hypothetical protein
MLFMNFTYKRWARGIAKAQVRSLRMVKRQFPQTPSPERYAMAIASRPGIDDEMAVEFVRLAYEMAEEAGVPGDVFRYVTLAVCNFDHSIRMREGHVPDHVSDIVWSAICNVVPSGI